LVGPLHHPGKTKIRTLFSTINWSIIPLVIKFKKGWIFPFLAMAEPGDHEESTSSEENAMPEPGGHEDSTSSEDSSVSEAEDMARAQERLDAEDASINGVKEAMCEIYRELLAAYPSHIIPNYFPCVSTEMGKVVEGNCFPVRRICPPDYETYKVSNTRYVEILWESTRNDCIPEPTRWGNSFIFGSRDIPIENAHLSFGSCFKCWRQSRVDFTACPYPEGAPLNKFSLPRLGLCGCICCNRCVREVEGHPSNLWNGEFGGHCPYCGQANSYSQHIRIWVVSEPVKNHWDSL
jgi:hypothetical protein